MGKFIQSDDIIEIASQICSKWLSDKLSPEEAFEALDEVMLRYSCDQNTLKAVREYQALILAVQGMRLQYDKDYRNAVDKFEKAISLTTSVSLRRCFGLLNANALLRKNGLIPQTHEEELVSQTSEMIQNFKDRCIEEAEKIAMLMVKIFKAFLEFFESSVKLCKSFVELTKSIVERRIENEVLTEELREISKQMENNFCNNLTVSGKLENCHITYEITQILNDNNNNTEEHRENASENFQQQSWCSLCLSPFMALLRRKGYRPL